MRSPARGAAKLYEFSSDEYERMAALGLIPQSGVELIHGMVVEMSPKGDRHGFVLSQLNEILTSHPQKRYRVYCDALSLRAAPKVTPDPDIALARLVRSYAKQRPTPSEIALIIEVAESSYTYDMGEKRAIYARAEIPEYWVFDVRTDRNLVHCFARPQAGRYLDRYDATIGDSIAPREFPGVAIALRAVFGLEED